MQSSHSSLPHHTALFPPLLKNLVSASPSLPPKQGAFALPYTIQLKARGVVSSTSSPCAPLPSSHRKNRAPLRLLTPTHPASVLLVAATFQPSGNSQVSLKILALSSLSSPNQMSSFYWAWFHVLLLWVRKSCGPQKTFPCPVESGTQRQEMQ